LNVTVPVPEGMPVEAVRMDAGDVFFFNGSVIHGSYPNRTADRFRRAAHSLKSNSNTFGARTLGAMARELELGGLARAEAIRLSSEYAGRPDDPAKDDPLDTAIWQASEAGHPAWDSPWGPGRPGWHAECAAMAMSVFGPAVDVHAGGADLRFPHHAYHAAMAEAFTGVRPYARAWLHQEIGPDHRLSLG
jgi:cysteinyl-tRNA synthetase